MSLDIRIWDVNHGNSASIKLPNGKVIMIDCARNPDTGFSPIMLTKNMWSCESLDYLIISHPHMDHISDFLRIDEVYPDKFRRPPVPKKKLLYNDKGEKLTGTKLDIINKYIELDSNFTEPVASDDKLEAAEWGGKNVNIETFRWKGEHDDLNDYSYVTFLSYGSFHYANGGDITSTGWEKLIEQEGAAFKKKLAKVNFFEASHHGRKEGFNSIIFEDMNPYLVLISDKKEQDTSVTDRYSKYCQGWDINNENSNKKEKGRKVLTTRNDGRIRIEVNDKYDHEVGVKTFNRYL